MKKIIAAAVATAFVAPAFAADVTLTGDLEFRYVAEDGEGMYSSYDDSDITVTATEELSNGMTVTAKISVEDVQSSAAGDVELAIAGGFGKLQLGEVDAAVNQVDELGSPAKFGGGAGNAGLDDTSAENAINTVSWTLPTMVDGLTVIASSGFSAVGSSAGVEDERTTTSVAVSYTNSGLTFAAGTLDREEETYDPSYVGVSYTTGGLTVGADSTSEDTIATTDTQSIGVTYALGNGASVYYETNETEVSGATTNDDYAGISYTIGGLTVAVESRNTDTAGADSTTVGVLYAF